MPASAMKIDLKKEFPDYYKAPRKPVKVILPPAPFVVVDGEGSPESEAFENAIGALYSVAYTLKFACKAEGNDFTVAPLEAFWWAGEEEEMTADPEAIRDVPWDEWRWKAMIRLPGSVTESQFNESQREALTKKELESIKSARMETVEEGMCVQMMHVGPYAAEPETVAVMHEFMRDNGLKHAMREGIGPHHEIYLSDPRRTAEEKLRTIVRIPVQEIA